MQTFVALLRGINVGKANRIAMADLRALLVELGYMGVATLLNSGNAVFRAENGPSGKHAKAIAEAISNRFGLSISVVVISAPDLAAIINQIPLNMRMADDSQLLVVFPESAAALQSLSSINQWIAEPEQFAMGESAAYLHCANGILASKAAKALMGKAGKAVTTRNWATVLKLQALAI
ncbi:MAG TPA: DUF1697 domain-containing protein [Aquabacterium sp.]|nr:DUF1697 domain-containing protein [Aquabacterium sp.]